jgi:hypothetical protein
LALPSLAQEEEFSEADLPNLTFRADLDSQPCDPVIEEDIIHDPNGREYREENPFIQEEKEPSFLAFTI